MRIWFPLGRGRRNGAKLYAHISLVIALLILAAGALGNPSYAGVAICSLTALVLIHEAGHALVVRYLGYEVTAIRLGLVHGICEYDASETTEWEHVLISWGGVAAQLVIALPLCLLDILWTGEIGILAPVVLILGYWSLVVIVLNLLPIEGLDGNSAWQIIPMLRARLGARRTVRTTLRKMRRGR